MCVSFLLFFADDNKERRRDTQTIFFKKIIFEFESKQTYMTMQKNAQIKIFEVEMWFPAFLFSESIEFCLKLKGYLQGILTFWALSQVRKKRMLTTEARPHISLGQHWIMSLIW